MTSDRRAGDSQTCSNCHLWQMAIPIQNATTRRVTSDLDQRCLKMRNSKNVCTFSPNISAPTPKVTPKIPFLGPFNAKPTCIHGALHKSHVNRATKLKLYSHIGIGKYLGNGVCQDVSARGRPGSEGPLNANLGPPCTLSRKLLVLELES